MSLDGSFSAAAALARLLARCPALRADPRLLALASASAAAPPTRDDVAAALAEPLLHTRYTVPVLGCFLPLARSLVDHAIALLRSAEPALRADDAARREEAGEGDIRVVEFYLSRGRGMRLHELACLALARALDLAPYLLRSVLSYFKFSPPPFQRLLCEGFRLQIASKELRLLLDAIQVSYRFLVLEPRVFCEQWDWSCFLDLVYSTADCSLVDNSLNSVGLDLRWGTIQIIMVVLKASDMAIESFGLGADEAFTCFLRWKEFCMDTSLEKASLYLQKEGCNSRNNVGGLTSLADCLSDWPEVVTGREHSIGSYACPFVLTATLRKSYEVALMAVSQKWPILLYGPVGAGKTALINKLAHIGGNRVLFIHMDEQMDGRTLIGSYICTEKPGEFKWAPGSLTQAIVKGFWIVFEDIDKAPSDVQSILLPLLEGSSSFSVGHAEAVEVAESFRLFATVTTSKNDVSHALEGRLTFSALWRKVMVGEPNRRDMVNIIKGCFPSLEPISSKLIETFEKVNSLVSNQFGGLNLAGGLSDGVLHRFSLRDLLKWCKRILGVDLNIEGLGFASSVCKLMYHEAVDIFAASLSSPDKRIYVAGEIAKVLGVTQRAETVQPTDKPIIQARHTELQVGRATLQCSDKPVLIQKGPFAGIRCALEILERVACSIKFNEPILLVGETGTGKTTTVQNLAAWLKQPLTVVNLSQQSDISDLLGGFKPTDARSICFPLYIEFKDLFCRSFSGKDNEAILHHCDVYVMEKKWKKLLRAMAKCVEKAQKLIEGSSKSCSGSKRKRPLPVQVVSEWDTFSSRLNAACSQIGSATGMSFQFVEGAFVSALRNGHWILLDEVNLAPPETLQRIGAVLDGERGTLCLAERGDVDYVERHPCFRMFACMNPATDAGKRELPYTFRSRFTEYFVDDLMDDDDLRLFVSKYLDGLNVANGVTDSIVRFYKVAKKESKERLQDGAHQKPQFSLRSLSRALGYLKNAEKKFGFRKALYDGFCMFFLTMLDASSAKIIKNLIVSLLLNGRVPPSVSFVDYFIEKPMQLDGCESDGFLRSYVLTNSVTEHIGNLARAVYIKRYPVLLQGPTSSGKTSLVRYLAAKTGHEFVRINNHEHTDLQEYLGTYVTDSHGKLQFQEGALVQAVREGHWIVLDELNLAPSDVLEALNRLLDDNRELFVPELQETIPAHPSFMLFATQNPPMLYGGRKMLSRAFRNRFIEVHVDEIPEDELITILEQRCRIAPSYARKMVEVMKDLQMHRQNSRVFAGKHGFITPRDLFRWANRYRTFEGKSYEDLAKDGYLLLAERLRDDNEKVVVQEALERHLRVKLNVVDLYNSEVNCEDNLSLDAIRLRVQECFGNITWTKSMWRLYFLIERCYRSREPVLLVGETGGGKTTVCQVLSAVLGFKLHILNCHQYTETSDFIGGFCPVRDRSRIALEFKHLVARIKQMKIFVHVAGDVPLETDISGADSIMGHLNEMTERYRKEKDLFPEVSTQDLDVMEQIKLDLMHLHKRWQAIFLWQDGPLVQAMKNGDLFLIDEVSLADDSVLERLNSVLEPERILSLAEKGGSVLEKIVAHPNFFILATMNPGGDYGKKELSPALRNRFTELWVPAVTDVDELKSITLGRFAKAELSCYGDCIVSFWNWFNQLHIGRTLTIRDLLSWISFINVTQQNLGSQQALIHGLFLILLDGLSLGVNVSKTEATKLRSTCLSFLLEELQKVDGIAVDSYLNDLSYYGWGDNIRKADMDHDYLEDHFGIAPFYIAKGHFACKQQGFEIMAPTTNKNVLRVLRGMQLPKPLLLEGSPGVGKTSLIVALAGFSGHDVVRINLSEQTDMMDLLGSDLPVEGANGMEFSWSDGILLQALKNGSWVLLDELNLAPQSVLEGLNAILDHRAEVFIPELGQTYKCPPSFRIFACQNPSSQGGGRKGLPKSFLNRFTKVYVDELSEEDYLFICKSRYYPLISESLLRNLIRFNNRLYMDTMIHRKYGQDGCPWEFNLRDIIRSCEIITGSPDTSSDDCFLNTVYLQRMRTAVDRHEVVKLFEEIFQKKSSIHQSKRLYVNPHSLVVGSASIRRNNFQSYKVQNNQLNIFPGILHSLEAAMHCIHQGWLCILVGQNSSGKTSLIRLLAQLSGNTLNELNLSSATDVSELLGCFEQYNFFRHYKAVISQVEHYIDVYFSMSMDRNWKNLIVERKGLFVKWFEFVAAKKYSSIRTSTFIEMSRNASLPSLCLVADIVEQMKCDLEMFDLPTSLTKDDLSKTLKSIYNLQQNGAAHQPVKFEWVAGDLIRAIECGEWIVLDNANFCNPTVLDRINSLVEQERSIVVNECGLVDGNPVVIKAHPKFRMFLTVNAKYGEVSRAMRNRGVEVFLMDQTWNSEGRSNVPGDSERKDIIRFLISCGIPRMELISSMSEAHMYAKASGLRLGINITLLEITRWVQLFQQLIIEGNQLLWSLHLSWEHTYLPSLGEVNGSDIVEAGKIRFLTNFDGSGIMDKRKFRFLTDFDGCSTGLHSGFSLSLPGGWPIEQKLWDFIWYSKETCVKRNCMYLQSLGAQYAAYQISNWKDSSSLLGPISNIHPSILPTTSLHELQFPTVSGQSVKSRVTVAFNSDLADQMLFFAANWVMEQSTEHDLEFYAIWFKWYNCLVQPYCNFFESFGYILKQESEHPIWHSILECYREIIAYHKTNIITQPIPLLSKKLLDMAGCDNLKACQNRLRNALNGLSLLRLTLQQWQFETNFPDPAPLKATLLPALKSLRCLEGEVLKIIVKSRKLLHIYSHLIDYHRSIWKMMISSQYEGLPVVWNLLRKEILKLQPKFAVEVGVFLMEFVNLNNLHDFNFQYEKPTLWVYGGHPLVPPSSGIFYKLQEILTFSAVVWPRKNILNIHLDEKQQLIDALLSANKDLRHLAMEGVSMASLVATKTEEDVSTVVTQLDEVHKRLVGKVDSERSNLELLSKTSVAEIKSCCSVASDIVCNMYGFNGWLASLPLLNLKSLNLDTILLQRLSKCTQKDSSEAHEIIANSKYLLKYAMDYSLESSSRSPLEYTQHQIIWWIHHAWATVDNVHVKVASSILEMWYNYHSFLWTYCSGSPKSLFLVTHDEACDLAHLTKMDAINTIIQQDLRAVDYQRNYLMLRISSRTLWEGISDVGKFVDSLQSAADSLFKQIIFVHKKHFKKEDYNHLESILFQQPKHYLEKEDLDAIGALLSSSSHGVLASLSGSNKLIEFLLMDLYSAYSRDSLPHIGAAWVHIGELRFRLLLSSYSPDPAFESTYKHSHILEKISLVELEGKVRHDCEELVGSSCAEDSHDQKLLQDLKTEEKDIRAKVVFRPQQSKHKSLVAACFEFEDRLSDCKDLLANLNCKGVGQLEVDRVCNWQLTSMNFIKRLTEEYGEYLDLVQPVQVAVYEMKFGLAIALSGSLQREYLKKIKEDDIERVLGTICAFMQFPSGSITKYAIDDQRGTQYSVFGYVDMLKKLAAVSSQLNVGKVADKVKSNSEMLALIHRISLVRITYCVSCSLIMDKASYLSLKDAFDHFTSMWINMKSCLKAKENDDSQCYKFRSRMIDVQDIFKEDVPSLSDMDSEGNAVPDNEEQLEHEFNRMMERINEDDDVAEDTWDLIPESALKCIVTIHDQLFGSPDLFEKPNKCQISDAQKIQSFIESYELGTRILKDLPELTCSMFDEKLMPEHLFRVCLEYQRTCVTSPDCSGYNAYKDPNPSVLFKMVEPLTTLQEKVRYYLDEWPEHPGLLKILDIIASLVAMPLSTPLSKALLGLQLLAGKAQTLQENDSKFFLKDHLAPIFLLVYSWQRLELDCWPILLEEVQGKYETNAVKLWFPLRAVLTQTSGIPTDENLSIIKSVEDFVQTSNLGEFKRRLHLLLAFHGEISGGASVGAYSSTLVKKILNILYNVFGYYMQFLSLVLGQIGAVKESIEKELKDQVKLYRWEQAPYSTASIENFKRTRQKIFKLLQRFNDILQKPVIVLLNEEATARKVPCWLDPQRPESQFPVDTEKFNQRFSWYSKWASQTSLSLQTLQHTNGTAIGVPTVKDVVIHNVNHRQDEAELNDRLKFFWAALERICGTANFANTLKHGKKNQKKTALSNLFKTLEECGLSKHRPMGHEWGDDLAAASPLFLEHSYDVAHLLQQVSSQKVPEDVSIVHSTLLTTDNWKHANQQYFKCLAMMQQLRQVSLKFNKDLGLEEVNRATSFMNHLLTILSEQRHLAYNLFHQLNQFQHVIFMLGSGGESKSLSSCQNVLLNSMWQQKKLFDSVLTMTTDTNLLLRSFKDCHYTSCNNINEEVAAMSTLLGKFIPRFSESKDLLDKFLLGSKNILAGAYKNMPLATREMEQLVNKNCQLIDLFRKDIQVQCHQDISMRSVKKVLLSRLEELLEKAKRAMENPREVNDDDHRLCSDVLQQPEASYAEVLKETFMLAVGVVGKLTDLEISNNGGENSPVESITSWKDILQSYFVNLKLDHICDASEKLCIIVRSLVDYKPEIRSSIEVQLMHLHAWLGVILSSAEGILSELLEAHRTTSEMTHALGDLLIYLFTEGFGSTEDTTEDADDERQQDALGTGTGMGEGEGQESATSKIDDISQIEGTEKDAMCKPDQAPKDDDNAIEMPEDFAAELSDVSEDPEGKDSGDEDEDMNLDNQMGDTGDASEVVGKKSWDNDEDDDPKTSTEKYESGSLAKGTEQNDRELRAKDEDCVEGEDPMEMDYDEQGKKNNLEDEPSTCEETDLDADDVMNKADAYDDRTGPELPEPEIDSEDVDMERQEQTDERDADNEEIGSEEAEQAEERSDDMDEGDTAQHDDSVVDNEGEHVEDANMEPNNIDKQQLDKIDSLMHPSLGIQPDNVQLDSNRESEANLANSSDMNGAVAPSVHFSGNEVPNLEISMPNTGDDSRLLSNSKPEMQNDASQSHIKQTNPFRSIGDAMEDWKERARVSADTQDHQPETENHSDDENAAEFRYVPEGEQSTSQALGAATADQINDDTQIKQPSLEDESRVRKTEQTDEKAPGDDNLEVPHLQASQARTSKSENANEFEGREIQTDTSIQDLVEGRKDNTFGDLVSFKQPPADDKIAILDGLTIDKELPTQMDLNIVDAETERAIVDWKNLELATMKLSQELAEQLRLVMEPTLASKLQGDYRTGKRINMKKVIPYIASHFRRDKIWLRRTKPNKRNYQVVIAVDDSRSMSEGKCGKVAIEALVTVCRAMSQLEVGQFAVASFGKKGNVRVLHDFDQIFNGEAGVNMISSLSFEQDNKIEDQPVADLLMHLNTMLDTAVARARTPSGQNPLQQLILIISDGKFHEKENLKRHVRDVLNRKRMVAYVLLDSPEDSIMNLKEARFKKDGEGLTLGNYMDSFPFPYYVMLNNIEALPRTLADLLRQWFELMQSANE
ncbi:midasin-like isoform X2 [Phragmites australis]|uniref:midasin-like isoform X2 n=1 Tax=Phragmites australis TaxID=29695 RepID=UPI002D78AD25|nr:midasin-like isoform X2 [Phragmites australis]